MTRTLLLVSLLLLLSISVTACKTNVAVELNTTTNGEQIMKKFDENYVILNAMYRDTYFPKHLVDKVKIPILNVVTYLESGETDKEKIQEQLDAMTITINNLQDEFDENDSEIETGARESIGETVEYILKWFDVDIDTETAISQRDW